MHRIQRIYRQDSYQYIAYLNKFQDPDLIGVNPALEATVLAQAL